MLCKIPQDWLGFFMIMKKCQWELMGHVCVFGGKGNERNAGKLNFYI